MKLNYTAKAMLAEYQCPHLKMTTVILKKKEERRPRERGKGKNHEEKN